MSENVLMVFEKMLCAHQSLLFIRYSFHSLGVTLKYKYLHHVGITGVDKCVECKGF